MTQQRLTEVVIPHLGDQFRRALPILFTGAGFSSGTRNRKGQTVPIAAELRRMLWELCFPGSAFDEAASLQDLYHTAQRRSRGDLVKLMNEVLDVEPSSIPDWYRAVFRMPWSRVYTLNLDNLAAAVAGKFELPRGLKVISATRESAPPGELEAPLGALQEVHLNGTLADLPEHVTFSMPQYGERLAGPELWYVRLAADLMTHSVVFIGTHLDEPPLWQHLMIRRTRGDRGLRELRPRSYLVTPSLDRAREAVLSDFNIEWIPMTAEEFAEEVLAPLESAGAAGQSLLAERAGRIRAEHRALPDVAALAHNPMEASEFLMGQEPIWADVQSGRAIARVSDEELWDSVSRALHGDAARPLLVITGTAGSGKSTALMRLCLRLSAEGKRVGWVDRDAALSPFEIKRGMSEDGGPGVLAIDDGDLFGSELVSLIVEVATLERHPLVIVALRSGRIDRFLNPARLGPLEVQEVTMPPLADRDIAALLEVLDREKRLGVLVDKSLEERQRAFREQAGRQLLLTFA